MYFRFALCFILFLFLVGCDFRVKTHEAPPKVTKVEPHVEGLGCLDTTIDHVKIFLKAQASNNQLKEFWGCTSTVLSALKKNVRGEDQDRYSAKELLQFLRTYYLQDHEITDALLNQMMLIKQIFIGGEAQYLTVAEIDKTVQEYIPHFRKVTLDLNPYMQIYAQKWQVKNPEKFDSDADYFEAANQQLQRSALDIASVIEKHQVQYNLENINIFLTELQKLFSEDWGFTRDASRYIPLIANLKVAVSGGDSYLVKATEWPSFLILSGRAYAQLMRFKYFIREISPDTATQSKIYYLMKTVDDTFSLFSDLLTHKKNPFISINEFYDVLESFSHLSADFKVSRAFVEQIFKVKKALVGGTDLAFTPIDFNRGRSKIVQFQQILDNTLASFKIYTLSWDATSILPEEKERIINESFIKLDSAINTLQSLFDADYDLANLEILFKEIESLYPPTNILWSNHQAVHLGAFIRDFKSMIWPDGGARVLQAKGQWGELLDVAKEFLKITVSSHYQYEQVKWAEGIKNPKYVGWLKHILSTLTKTLNYSPNKALSAEQVVHLSEQAAAFVPNWQLSGDLVKELVLVKSALTGSEGTRVQSLDVNYLLQNFDSFQEILIFWYEHRDWLGKQIDPKQFSEAELKSRWQNLTDSLKLLLARHSSLLKGTYDLNRIEALLRALKNNGYMTLSEEGFTNLMSSVPLLIKLKIIAWPQGKSIVEPRQWSSILNIGADVVSADLWHYFLFPTSLDLKQSSHAVVTGWIQQWMDILSSYVDLTPQKRIRTLDISELIHLFVTHQKPKDLTEVGLKSLINPLLSRILVPAENIFSGYKPKGLEPLHINYLQQQFKEFVDTTHFIRKFYVETYGESASVPQAQVIADFEQKILATSTHLSAREDLQRLQKSMQGSFTQLMNDKGVLQFNREDQEHFNLSTMLGLNIYRTIAQLVLNSYSPTLKRSQKFSPIEEKYLQILYNDVYLFFLDLKILDPRNTTFVTSRFLEANLFTPFADGDKIASIEELIGLCAQVYSGVQVSNVANLYIETSCPPEGHHALDRKISESCLRGHYPQIISQYFLSMPEFRQSTPFMSEERFGKLISGMEKTSGYYGQVPQIGQTDYALMPHVAQFIETLMFRYDLDQTGSIDREEAKRALPLLGPLLEEISGMSSEKNQLAVLTYFLKYGEAPNAWNFVKWRIKGESNWDINAGRDQLAAILGFIAEQAAKEAQQQ